MLRDLKRGTFVFWGTRVLPVMHADAMCRPVARSESGSAERQSCSSIRDGFNVTQVREYRRGSGRYCREK